MSILEQLASAHYRNDEILNQQLAEKISQSNTKNTTQDIQELVTNLQNKDKAIQSDCIKVLYEIGTLKPELIANYADNFVELLHSRNNRMVWGAMTALGSIASIKAPDLWQHVNTIMRVTEKGSVITQDWGIRVLATMAAADSHYAEKIFPFLMTFLENCRLKDVPRHAESSIIVVKTPAQKERFRQLLEKRRTHLKPSQLKRVDCILKTL